MKTPLYNIEQRVMALNWFSNMASNKFNTTAELQANLTQTLEGLFKDDRMIELIGKWTLEWGPIVVSEGKDDGKKTQVSTNAMFVARQEKYDGVHDHYVVAIAGTNAISRYGWFIEDFYTNKMVLWRNAGENNCQDAGSAEPEAPRVSKGTCIGLGILLNMQWQPTHVEKKLLTNKTVADGQPQTLLQFLTARFGGKDAPADLLTVTGHSLGGALSSAMALRLSELQWNANHVLGGNFWNPSNSVTLTAMPTAGATPGNKAFSDYYGNQMGMKTIRVWNAIDPVPHGHEPSMLRYLPQLYYPYIVPDIGIYAFADYLLAKSLIGTEPTATKGGGYYTQLMPQTAPMPGQFNSVFAPLPPGLILRFCVDYVVKQVLDWLKVPENIIKNVITGINDVIKIETVFNLEGLLLKHLFDWLVKITGTEKYLDSIMKGIKWLLKFFSSFFAYLQQLGYQHVWAYPDLLKMTGFQEVVKDYTKANSKDDLESLIKTDSANLGKMWQEILTPQFLEKNLVAELA